MNSFVCPFYFLIVYIIFFTFLFRFYISVDQDDKIIPKAILDESIQFLFLIS